MSKNARPMKRKTKQLIIFLAVLAVIAAGVAALLLLPQEGEEPAPSSKAPTASSETVALIDHEQGELKSLVISNEKGTIELIAEAGSTSSGAVTVAYSVKGMEGVTLLNSAVQSHAEYGYSLNATRSLGEQNDLAAYGLDRPAAEYTAAYTDGTSVTISIGDAVPGSVTQYYVKRSGDKSVYLAPVGKMLKASRDEYLAGTILSLMVTNEAGQQLLPTFDKIRISGRDHDEPIVIFPREKDLPANSTMRLYTYYMSEPTVAGMTSKLEDEYLTPLATLEATGFPAVNPTEEELQQYGLDQPIELRLWTESGKTALLIGKVEGSTAYVMLEGGKVIYSVDAADIALATTPSFDLLNALMFLCDITTVEKFTFVDDSGKSYVFNQERTEIPPTSSTAADAEPDYDYAAYYNDLQLQYYKKFYQSVLTAYREEEIPADAQPGAKLFSLTLDFYDEFDGDPITIAAYAYSDRRVIYQLDGENLALIKSSWAEKVLSDFVKLINDEEIQLL